MSKNKKNWKAVMDDLEQGTNAFVDEDLKDLSPAGVKEGNNAALEHPSYEALEEKLTLAEQKAHENQEKAMRLMAELDNVRRRAERDVSMAHRYGVEKIISALLPIIDSLEQAMQSVDKTTHSSMVEGLELTLKLFIDVLEKFDVKRLDPVGELFNPQEHEAMTLQEVPGTAANTIVAVFQKGYKLHDRLIRPARVIVAKGD